MKIDLQSYIACDSFKDFCDDILSRRINLDLVSEQAHWSTKERYPIFIILQHSGTKLANVIKFFTGDEFSHACIAFNTKLDPIYSFGEKSKDGTKGFVIQPGGPKHEFYSRFKVRYNVYVMYIDRKSVQAMKNRLQWFIDHDETLKYDLPGLVNVWVGRDSESPNKYFCSRFVMDIIKSGHDTTRLASLYKPQDIANTLDNITLVNHGLDFSQYNHKETEKNMRLIREGKFDEIKYVTESFL